MVDVGTDDETFLFAFHTVAEGNDVTGLYEQ